MTRLLLLSLAISVAAPALAQSNTVSGLDGRLYSISQFSRQGTTATQVGYAARNDMCNVGTVNIPWNAPMAENHPMFGFLLTRTDANGDRIVQISDRSFCKHAFLTINITTQCGSCGAGSGSSMGLGCADIYGVSNNADRNYLGPADEIDPWLGTWTAQGSYFDQGFPNVGAPGNNNGSRSPINPTDSVMNRITVNKTDIIAGSSYHYAFILLHRGESLANRADNIMWRETNINASTWASGDVGSPVQGCILNTWPGATVNSGSNGTDEGTFYVASKVTPISGNDYRYEYAIQNVDNSRGAAAMRIPLGSGVTASNFFFRDIDDNALNEWTASQVGNEVIFTAPAGNPLNWNTIYNFGFDADLAPGAGVCRLDQARPGAGALTVDVATEVPGGVLVANFSTYGVGCEGTVALPPAACPQVNPNGGTLSNQTNQYEYCYETSTPSPLEVTGFEIWTRSNTGGAITRPAHIYASVGGSPSSTPLASTTITVGVSANFYTATLSSPVTVNGTFYVGYENSPNGVISELTSGTQGNGYYRTAVTGSWALSGLVDFPSFRVLCNQAPQFAVPVLSNTGLPVIDSSYNIDLADALPSSAAIILSGLSDTTYNGTPLPAALPNAPSCNILAAPSVTSFALTSPTGTASSTFSVPNNSAFAGIVLYHQWAVLDPANDLGIVVSNGGRATAGN
ncbi:MAG: hypothetical protein VYE77_10455 [Planctomycetota bacterium]|nr:hypothetical protein [Planctomycetota bacterium]